MKQLRLDKTKLKDALWFKNAKCAAKMGLSKQTFAWRMNKTKKTTLEDINDICRFLKRDVTDFVSVVEK